MPIRFRMVRHLLLAVFSFAVVGIVVFPYWVAVERLETGRDIAERRATPIQISLQCPVAESGRSEVAVLHDRR